MSTTLSRLPLTRAEPSAKAGASAPSRPWARAVAAAWLALGVGAAAATPIIGNPVALLSFGDVVATSSSIQGSVAVGGNARFQHYSLRAASGQPALVVAGDLGFPGGSIQGDVVVGGRLTSSYSGSFGGRVAVGGTLDASAGLSAAPGATTVWGAQQGVQPWFPEVRAGSGGFSLGLDFVAERARLGALTGWLAEMPDTGQVQDAWGTLRLDASGLALAVFTIDAADAARNMQIVGLGADAAVVINVMGDVVDFGNHGYDGFGAGQVLFNLPEARSVRLNGGVMASLLAPTALVEAGWGQLTGQAVVGGWNGNLSIQGLPFAGAMPAGAMPVAAVPEPGTSALLLAGLAALLLMRRRRLH